MAMNKNSNYKNGVMRKFGVLFLSTVFLSGCAALPFHGLPSYARHIYKRLPCKVEGRYRVINIFYATDRKVKEGKSSSVKFKRELAKGLSYGNIKARIDPNIKIGKMLPRKIKRKGLIGIQEVSEFSEEDFMNRLAAEIEDSPQKSLLVIVFGYKDDFDTTAIKAAYFTYLLDADTPILLFDWPGDQRVSIMGYLEARKLADASGPYLGELLVKIIRRIGPEKLWIKASSLGCEAVCEAFDYMNKHEDMADAQAEIDHVVLAAPDVGKNDFDRQFKDELSALSEKLTAYVSSDDEALLLSSLIKGKRMLGLIKVKEGGQLEEAKDLLFLKSIEPDKIALVDVTPISSKTSYRHGYYLESPEFFDDFYLRLFGEKPHANRRLYLMKVKDDTDYWILRSDD